ncbi:hypothetical protein G6F32_016345 [Rhizopus arrhizus]|nr:hypothetical protein G6F32_016345 [Rhizopus arrhizus]
MGRPGVAHHALVPGVERLGQLVVDAPCADGDDAANAYFLHHPNDAFREVAQIHAPHRADHDVLSFDRRSEGIEVPGIALHDVDALTFEIT